MKKFIASFSGGKDSTLAIYRAIQSGMKPVSLITTYNTYVGRSWFHGIPEPLFTEVSKSLHIPYQFIKTTGAEYAANFDKALKTFSDAGVDAVVFGDIDIKEHRTWCTERCNIARLEAVFPLWQENRCALTYEFIDLGFKSVITIVDTKRLPERFLGKVLTREVVLDIVSEGADACGENGEYHTFAFDGSLFEHPVPHRLGELWRNGDYAGIVLQSAKSQFNF